MASSSSDLSMLRRELAEEKMSRKLAVEECEAIKSRWETDVRELELTLETVSEHLVKLQQKHEGAGTAEPPAPAPEPALDPEEEPVETDAELTRRSANTEQVRTSLTSM